jgi:hypothetical protein
MESPRLYENLKDQRIPLKNSKLSVRPRRTLSIMVCSRSFHGLLSRTDGFGIKPNLSQKKNKRRRRHIWRTVSPIGVDAISSS